jgi:hypothetical protein
LGTGEAPLKDSRPFSHKLLLERLRSFFITCFFWNQSTIAHFPNILKCSFSKFPFSKKLIKKERNFLGDLFGKDLESLKIEELQLPFIDSQIF